MAQATDVTIEGVDLDLLTEQRAHLEAIVGEYSSSGFVAITEDRYEAIEGVLNMIDTILEGRIHG